MHIIIEAMNGKKSSKVFETAFERLIYIYSTVFLLKKITEDSPV